MLGIFKRKKSKTKEVDYSKLLKEAFATHGHISLLGTDACEFWKRHHKNCYGCKSEKVCAKMDKWFQLTLAHKSIPENFFSEV